MVVDFIDCIGNIIEVIVYLGLSLDPVIGFLIEGDEVLPTQKTSRVCVSMGVKVLLLTADTGCQKNPKSKSNLVLIASTV